MKASTGRARLANIESGQPAEEYRGKYGTMWLPARRRRQLRNQTREDVVEHLEPVWEMGVPDEMEDQHVEIHETHRALKKRMARKCAGVRAYK